MAKPGPIRGFSTWDPVKPPPLPAQPFTVHDSAYWAALMGANIGRYNVYWSGLQPNNSTNWDYAQLDKVKSIVAAARAGNPAYKMLIMFDGIPNWVDGRSANGRYMTTDQGASQYGIAVAHMMGYLGDTCDFVELANEVNQHETPSTPHACDIPPDDYGRMGAYAVHWVDYCLGASKNVILGALALMGAPDTLWLGSAAAYAMAMANATNTVLYLLYPAEDQAVKRQSLQSRWRASLHAYPRLGANGDKTGEAAFNTVKKRYNDLVGPHFPGRKVWITETGVSSGTVGPAGQKDFHRRLCDFAEAKQPQLEGLVNFGFTDLDPMMPPPGPFSQMGVISANLTYKPAGVTLSERWPQWP